MTMYNYTIEEYDGILLPSMVYLYDNSKKTIINMIDHIAENIDIDLCIRRPLCQNSTYNFDATHTITVQLPYTTYKHYSYLDSTMGFVLEDHTFTLYGQFIDNIFYIQAASQLSKNLPCVKFGIRLVDSPLKEEHMKEYINSLSLPNNKVVVFTLNDKLYVTASDVIEQPLINEIKNVHMNFKWYKGILWKDLFKDELNTDFNN